MNKNIVEWDIKSGVAHIQMSDGGKNLISPAMISALNAALDEAEANKAVVVLSGDNEIFSAGFDLKVLKTGVVDAFNMLIGGFQLAERLLSFHTPVVIACSGHAMAMGAFLLLAGDYRIGCRGPFKIATNEVAIGLTMPYSAIEICRQRLVPAHFERAVELAETYSPESAVEAGFLDKVVPADALLSECMKHAKALKELDLNAHTETKLRSRHDMLKSLRRAINRDRMDFVKKGVTRLFAITRKSS